MNAGNNVSLDTQVERIRGSRILDRSQSLTRLFDYLAQAAREGRSLREAEVAQDVFGRLGDLSGDASVRVCIHRLRRKLHDFYAGEGASEVHRLSVPLGEYRLVVEEAPQVVAPATSVVEASASGPKRRWMGWAMAAGVMLAAVNVGAWMVIARDQAPAREVAKLSRTPLWSTITGKRPVLVVVGDYFIFGERGDAGLQRLVRDFDVNSSEEFDEMLMGDPSLAQRYVDINTYYTPVGATLALQRILPVVRQAAGDPKLVQVITSSQLTPEMLKGADVVYVGYFSALRLLNAPLFSRSRFEIGANFDELVDRTTKRTYVSGAGPARGDELNEDIGYIAAFGVSGRRFVIIAGTRDIGVIQAAEIATDTTAQGSRKRPDPINISEDIYQVRGMGRTNLGAIHLLPDGTRGARVTSGK